VIKILRRKIKRKIEAALGEGQFEFRGGKVTRVAIEMLTIISK
jgi:hypothetical protein